MADKSEAVPAAADVESGTATPEEIKAALSGITLGRTYPVTIPKCPYCHKKNVMTKLNTHATGGTYAMCVILGICSCLVFWWLPLVLDSVRFHQCVQSSIIPYYSCTQIC